jgi:hypothetical protein
MKNIILILLGLVFSMVVHAEQSDNSSMCGIGWKVADKISVFAASVRSTTNSYTSSFAMTSGTSGCKRHKIVLKEQKPLYYVASNFENLKAEMAQGQGEFIQEFASVYNCPAKPFARFLQGHYPQIISANATPESIVSQVQNLMQKHPCK